MSIDHKFQVPTVAVHTDIFERVTKSVARVNGMPKMRQVYVPQPVYPAPAYAYSRDPAVVIGIPPLVIPLR